MLTESFTGLRLKVLLYLGDRLIGVGHQALVGAVEQQVQLLQDGLPNQDLVAQDQGLFHGIAVHYFHDQKSRRGGPSLLTLNFLPTCRQRPSVSIVRTDPEPVSV